jgi:hypothetical protein
MIKISRTLTYLLSLFIILNISAKTQIPTQFHPKKSDTCGIVHNDNKYLKEYFEKFFKSEIEQCGEYYVRLDNLLTQVRILFFTLVIGIGAFLFRYIHKEISISQEQKKWIIRCLMIFALMVYFFDSYQITQLNHVRDRSIEIFKVLTRLPFEENIDSDIIANWINKYEAKTPKHKNDPLEKINQCYRPDPMQGLFYLAMVIFITILSYLNNDFNDKIYGIKNNLKCFTFVWKNKIKSLIFILYVLSYLFLASVIVYLVITYIQKLI